MSRTPTRDPSTTQCRGRCGLRNPVFGRPSWLPAAKRIRAIRVLPRIARRRRVPPARVPLPDPEPQTVAPGLGEGGVRALPQSGPPAPVSA